MFRIIQKGNFNKTTAFLDLVTSKAYLTQLQGLGERGVAALQAATPVETGETASSWSYTITDAPDKYTIAWHNSAMAGSAPLAVLIQYGHGTRNGGYVYGQDYINPAIQPIFDEITKEAWDLLTNG